MNQKNPQAANVLDASLSVVVAAYNEEEAILLFLKELHGFLSRHLRDWEIILVNDGSTDQTAQRIDHFYRQHERVTCVHLEKNSGMGAALKSGYGLCAKEWVTMFPADGQIKPQELLKLIDVSQDADIVTTLYDNRKYSLSRKVISLGLRMLTTLVVGTRARTEGNYLIRRKILNLFPLYSNSFLLNLEIPIRARRAGYRIKTVFISVSPRIAGVSKAITRHRIWQTFYELFLLRIQLVRNGPTIKHHSQR